jgi:hypothetical protein
MHDLIVVSGFGKSMLGLELAFHLEATESCTISHVRSTDAQSLNHIGPFWASEFFNCTNSYAFSQWKRIQNQDLSAVVIWHRNVTSSQEAVAPGQTFSRPSAGGKFFEEDMLPSASS